MNRIRAIRSWFFLSSRFDARRTQPAEQSAKTGLSIRHAFDLAHPAAALAPSLEANAR